MAATPAEWGEAVSVALMACRPVAVVFFLTVDADLADFDPRPLVRRAIESPAADRVLIAVGPALHDARQTVRHALRAAAVTVAALLALLLPATGGTR